jgi:uncharacterized membrane protein YkvA (DUF1232 family)
MLYSHLLSILQEAQLSPEQLAKRMGISGMTVRRWEDKDPHEELPLLYQKALQDVVSQLVAESHLRLDSAVVKAVAVEGTGLTVVSADNSLGITRTMLHVAERNPKALMERLSMLGAQEAKKSEVDRHKKKILSFKKMGQEWSARITSLMKVLNSDELHTFDKMVAYGALFYLLCPFDLIPDYIPVFGYMDDFIVLGFAAAYYFKRFPKIFPKEQ